MILSATLASPELTVGLALLCGVVAQIIAWHLSIPGIVMLLAFGVLLGPDLAAIVRPESLGDGLSLLVGFAVAIILFEGGLNLDLKRLRRSRKAIRRLVTLGALVTATLASVTARLWMGWGWNVSILFGTLVIVTGPTVVGPLMRRLNVERKTAALLEGEGVLIDPIGAIVAVVALEIALAPSLETSIEGVKALAIGLGGGSLIGVAGGLVIAYALRVNKLIPHALTNIFTLSAVIALFQGAEALAHESGIAAVTVAGIVVRWRSKQNNHDLEELQEFKEQLTMLMIGMLFVLLAADVRVADVRQLGWRGVATVVTLMLLVRPACVFLGTARGGLRLRQRIFMSWIGPRGIVAAAVASLFAVKMEHEHVAGGVELRALTFLVIATTVVVAGLTGGLLARLLGLKRRSNHGWLIMGANALAREMARALSDHGQPAVMIDRNAEAARFAEEAGLTVLYGNALEERTLRRGEVDTRAGALAMTRNEEVNMLFAARVQHYGKLEHVLVTLDDTVHGVTLPMVHAAGCRVLFGQGVDIDWWSQRLKRDAATASTWLLHERVKSPELRPPSEAPTPDMSQEVKTEALAAPFTAPNRLFVPLVIITKRGASPVHEGSKPDVGDEAVFVLDVSRYDEARAQLTALGWRESTRIASLHAPRPS
ncbi:MAG: sodium:proton antiporter [Myxococcales bacterium]|nr:sodium:proton antiporter [Myxococcales bacterium]MCB9751241.1 sodium:proton antiporter [Myxococcales bacterium]